MFILNLRSWKHQPFVQANYPAATIDRLEEELLALAQEPDGKVESEWGMRQLVFERV